MSITVYDNDLNPIIEKASNEELQFLVDVLTKTMTNGLNSTEEYKQFSPDHRKYANLIAKEIREFGGNSFVNVWRKEGPAYKEILCYVSNLNKLSKSKSGINSCLYLFCLCFSSLLISSADEICVTNYG